MRGNRLLALLLALCVIMVSAAAEGVTLHTVSCFAGADRAAEAYVSILRQYETQTGNTVIDRSAASDEAWKTGVLHDFAAGNEPDVLFFFAAGADSAPILGRVVPISLINQEYPDAALPINDALCESDGQVYAIPARSYWEGLYVNTDVFESVGVPLPTDWDSLVYAVSAFREAGIVPIAVSLSDIPHYLAEFAILACAAPEEQQARPASLQEVPQSWYQAMSLIRELYCMHAFADNVFSTYESASTDLFLTKQAAMQFDGSWLAASLPPENMDTTAVLPIPLREGQGVSDCYIGGISMGFYLTRRAWNSDRRDAAVQLLQLLTRQDSLQRLGNTLLRDRLQDSAMRLTEGRSMLSPLQDAMNSRAREMWLLECVPAVAGGTMSPEECWQRVMALHPFGE
ncbi:MAG: carbohydrate ABC transporter substrate-binding protein [Clostridia bacterium]|nr:carbohydrate ABC transporter substrate-binding protein [Clostridia bacterium]